MGRGTVYIRNWNNYSSEMPMNRLLSAVALMAALDAGSAAAAPSQDPAKMPAGTYGLEKSHASVVARVRHLGLAAWALALLNICVAVYGYFYASRPWLAYVVWAGLAGVLLSSVLTVLFDPDRSAAAQAEGYDNADGGARYGKFDDETLIGSLYDQSPARGSMNSGI